MRAIVDSLLERFGVEAVVKGVHTKILLQFSNSKSWDSMNPIITPVGQLPSGQYLYIGPGELEIRAGDEVVVGNQAYIMRRCEAYQCAEGAAYRWALCALKGKEDQWGYHL